MVYDAAVRFREGVSTIIVPGKEYGSGFSPRLAGKGPSLLGVGAVIAESHERIPPLQPA